MTREEYLQTLKGRKSSTGMMGGFLDEMTRLGFVIVGPDPALLLDTARKELEQAESEVVKARAALGEANERVFQIEERIETLEKAVREDSLSKQCQTERVAT